ncbi:MAG TPA: hypothetical protein VKB78_14685 [Pirellulales bacterium]|nr:hypothetical protein [Pirellulales bacterium]
MITDGSPKPPQSTATDSDGQHDAEPQARGPDALSAVFKQLAEAIEYLAYLLAAQVDRVKLKVRNIILLAALGVIAVAMAAAVLFCTIWLLLSGIAGGIGAALGDRPWLGAIITSVVILIIATIALWIVYRRVQKSGWKAVRERYERRQHEQKARFGREVKETASESL